MAVYSWFTNCQFCTVISHSYVNCPVAVKQIPGSSQLPSAPFLDQAANCLEFAELQGLHCQLSGHQTPWEQLLFVWEIRRRESNLMCPVNGTCFPGKTKCWLQVAAPFLPGFDYPAPGKWVVLVLFTQMCTSMDVIWPAKALQTESGDCSIIVKSIVISNVQYWLIDHNWNFWRSPKKLDETISLWNWAQPPPNPKIEGPNFHISIF